VEERLRRGALVVVKGGAWCLVVLAFDSLVVVVVLAGLRGVGGWFGFKSGLERVMNYGECLA
jgi:hypothetical protein